ncbi:DNA ligase 3 isoform X1 [Athalia rosae]|uniref:DNA ligase 3 isoform X1 n=1 Tax=Athalia rosae TaxID=37344 RepID=UPI0020334FD9|nr:DNA ligase 3 isoform X1 [Athalia rosae]
MSDDDRGADNEKPFAIERAKTGRAKCKKCKCPIDQGLVRIAKLMTNPFGDGKMKAWHHLSCMFDVFAKQRASTKRIEDPEDDVSGWDAMDDEGKEALAAKLEDFENSAPFKKVKKNSPPKKVAVPAKAAGGPSKVGKPTAATAKVGGGARPGPSTSADFSANGESSREILPKKTTTKDDSFREFRRLCAAVSNASAYTSKTSIVREKFAKGSDGDGFKSDVILWCKMLLPGITKRIYNLQSKQLIKLFSRLFNKDEDDMLEHLEQGDVAETIQIFFEKSSLVQPSKTSDLTIQEVDEFLEKLSRLTKEDEQTQHLKSILVRCTANDLKMIIRLVKHDLRITAGPKHILDAIHEDAYEAFQASRDLESVVARFVKRSGNTENNITTDHPDGEDRKKPTVSGSKIGISLMTPVLPMLAEACKSVAMAMKKCPKGMLSEIKYDGERVQVHKRGEEFRYFSRSLKPVMPHKVNHFKDYIPKAFPGGDDLILDTEVLMIDTNTGKPLPFGSLGVHKKAEFKDANVCLFVFDCLYYNGEPLMEKSMQKRRQILKDKMTVIPNRIMLSEVEEVQDPKDLANMIAKVIKLGLEGLVLKDVTGKYEPGKRHWLKVKKDYLLEGAMADTADLVVLGAWYGTGKKGGMKSVFLMGCYDEDKDRWVTVTKVHTGHDDATLARLQGELEMDKIAKDVNLKPRWLHANKPMVPDFVAKDPKKQPVWEITGAEFTNQGVHTADGISIRFPRVTRIRDDKDWRSATSLKELRVLFGRSSDSVDVDLLLGNAGSSPPTKQRTLEAMLRPARSENSDDSSVGNKADESEDSPARSDRKPSLKPSGGRDEIDAKKNGFARGAATGNAGRRSDVDEEDRPVEGAGRREATDENREDRRRRSESKRKIENDPGDDDPRTLPSTSTSTTLETVGRIDTKRRKLTTGSPETGDERRAKNKTEEPFDNVRVALAEDIDKDDEKTLSVILTRLGAKMLNENTEHLATHVIHSSSEVPWTIVRVPGKIPPTARHVTKEWVEACYSDLGVPPDPKPFAVTLTASHCTCPCPHQS